MGQCTFLSYNDTESTGGNIIHNPGFGPFEVAVFKGFYIETCKENYATDDEIDKIVNSG